MLVIMHRNGSSGSSASFVLVQLWCLGGATARGLQSSPHQTTWTLHLAVSCSITSVSSKLLLYFALPTAGFQMYRRFQLATLLNPCIRVIILLLIASSNVLGGAMLASLLRAFLKRDQLDSLWHN